MSDDEVMKGHEFVKKVQQIGKKQNIEVFVNKERGKGSHVTLYFGERFTVVRNLKDELKKGTLHGMLKQLGLSIDDIL